MAIGSSSSCYQVGKYHFFNVPPTRQFMIDGQAKRISDLKPGIVLTATVATYSQTVTERTTTITNGTVWYVSQNYVIVTLENGENHGTPCRRRISSRWKANRRPSRP